MRQVVELSCDPAGCDPAREVALGPLLLRSGPRDWYEMVRIRVPSPTAAFSRRDSMRPGFVEAVAAVHSYGFAAVVRPQGGRLAAYHEGSVIIDHVVREAGAASGLTDRFERFAVMHAGVLRAMGLDARVGALAGEYCPGAYSINAAGLHKIAGSAQRVTREGWLFSTVVQVTGGDRLRTALVAAYAALDHPLDQTTVGVMDDHLPGVTAGDVAGAMRDAYTASRDVRRLALPAEVLALLDAAAAEQRVP